VFLLADYLELGGCSLWKKNVKILAEGKIWEVGENARDQRAVWRKMLGGWPRTLGSNTQG